MPIGARPERLPVDGRLVMLDVIMLGVGCVFFVAAILYTIGCDRI